METEENERMLVFSKQFISKFRSVNWKSNYLLDSFSDISIYGSLYIVYILNLVEEIGLIT